MQPLAAFVQKPRYGGVGAEGFEEFEFGGADRDEMCLDALVIDAFVFIGTDLQQRLVESGDCVRVLHGDTDVFEVGHDGEVELLVGATRMIRSNLKQNRLPRRTPCLYGVHQPMPGATSKSLFCNRCACLSVMVLSCYGV